MDLKNWKEKAGEWKSKSDIQRNNFFQMCKENTKMITVIAVFVVVVVGVAAVIGFSEKKENGQQAVAAVGTEESMAASDTEGTMESTEEAVILEEALEKDAYPEINNLVKQYYQALVDGDMDVIHSIKSHTEEEEAIKIVKKSEFIDSYPSITVYTKKGPEEGSFVAYVQYEVKFTGQESTAPGLNTLYICTKEDGSYYINSGNLPDDIVNSLKEISVQNDVIDLFNTVQVQYNEVKEQDEELSVFLDELPGLLAESVSLAMAELEASREETKEEEPAEPEVITIVKTVKTTDVVNVRSSDSIEADRIGKTTLGQVLELVEEKVNGWSHVKFNGKDGYIKSEFLVPEEVETVTKDENGEIIETPEMEEAAEETDSGNETVSGEGKVNDTVNVREKPNTDCAVLGVLGKGSKIEIIEKQSNGWTKIKYGNGSAYVKTEFVDAE